MLYVLLFVFLLFLYFWFLNPKFCQPCLKMLSYRRLNPVRNSFTEKGFRGELLVNQTQVEVGFFVMFSFQYFHHLRRA